MGSQSVGHDLVTEKQHSVLIYRPKSHTSNLTVVTAEDKMFCNTDYADVTKPFEITIYNKLLCFYLDRRVNIIKDVRVHQGERMEKSLLQFKRKKTELSSPPLFRRAPTFSLPYSIDVI